MKPAILAGTALLALIASPSFAQQAAPAAAAATEDTAADEQIIVTGSRITRPQLDSAVPVTSLSITEVTQTGELSVGDAIQLLPAFRTTFSTQNSGRFIGTAGLNLLDLRGLGTERTLVVVNNRRHIGGQTGSYAVDVNTIPVELIERVDVVTGGSSAIYGSDAVAGVVNFVLKRDFDGLRIRAQSGISQRADRGTQLVSLTAGRNFNEGRGNIAVALEFSNQDQLLFTDRDELTGAFSGRSQFNLTQNVLNESAAGDGIPDRTFVRGVRNLLLGDGSQYTSACPVDVPGNAAVAARRALNCTGLRNQANTAELGRSFFFLNDGTLAAATGTDLRPFGSNNIIGPLGSTLRLTGQLQPAVTRYAANLLARYEVAEAFQPFIEAKYVRADSLQEGQPTFTGTLANTIRLDNPFLSTQARDLLTVSLAPGTTTFPINRFNVDLSGRGEDHRRETYRVVAGVEGTFNDDWRYEISGNYGYLRTYYETAGNVNVARWANALDATRNAAGNIVCRVNADAITTNDDPACAPLNPFGVGNISQAARDYVLVTSTRRQFAEQVNFLGFVSGDLSQLFELPGGPIGFSVGAEYRQERSKSEFDEFTRSGATFLNAIGVFDPPTLRVKEAFGEIRVPLLADRPFFQELTLEAAGRVSDYNIGRTGTVYAWNAGGIWSPVRGLRARAGYARSIRAPSQTNLFGSQNQTFLNNFVDPCSQNNIRNNPNRVANCAAAGVPTTQTFNGVTEPFTNIAASGISGLNGSNPNLEEERGTSFTAGFVLAPPAIPGLVLSVDYYNIEVKNAIFTLTGQTIINQCYDAPGGINNPFCAAVFRNPNGTLRGQDSVTNGGQTVTFPRTGAGFTQGPFNFARLRTSGVDFDLGYNRRLDSGARFGARVIGSYLIKRDNYTDVNRPDFINQQKLELGDPEWSGQLRLSAGVGKIDLFYNLRLVSGTSIDNFNIETFRSVQGRPAENPDFGPFALYPTYVYNDIRAEFAFSERGRFYGGIDNLTDLQPPYGLLGTEEGAGVYPNVGRYFYVGIELNL